MENNKKPYIDEDMDGLPSQGWEAMRKLLDEHLPQEKKRRIIPMYWKWIAAALLLIVAGFGYWKFEQNKQTNGVVTSRNNHDSLHAIVKNSDLSVSKTTLKDSSRLVVKNKKEHLQFINDKKTSKRQREIAILVDTNFVAKNKKSEKHYLPNSFSSNNYQISDDIPNHEIASDRKPIVLKKIDTTKTGKTITNTPNTLVSNKGHFEKYPNVKIVLPNNQNLPKGNNNQLPVNVSISNANTVEGQSNFRKQMNEALAKEESQSDSLNDIHIAEQKKIRSDSQMIALRRKELERYFGKEENDAKADATARKLDVAVLLNRNLNDKSNSGNNLYDIPLYPSVTASYKISNKIGFTTGLGTAAPGNFTGTSASTSNFYSAATANSFGAIVQTDSKTFLTSNSVVNKEVRLTSNYTNEVRQAYYWQIPLMVDYYVPMVHLKFSAGTDLSLVQKVLVVNGQSSQLMNGNEYNAAGGIYQIRNFDPRLSLGAQYKFKKTLIGARFSRSFLSAIEYNGLKTNGGNNQIFNISIGYSLF